MDGPVDDWPYAVRSEGIEIGAPLWGPWTVREEELRDLRELLLGMWAAYNQSKPLEKVVALALSGACMIWRLRRRGVSVNELQRAVLLALRRHRALDVDGIVREAAAFGTDWTRADVQSTLEELSAVRLNDGTVVALVQQDAGKFWSTSARGLWEVPFGAVG
jgi:hypothetical protein